MSYVCTTCDYTSATKLGKCPNCGEFGSFIKHPESGKKSSNKSDTGQIINPSSSHQTTKHYTLNHTELERIYPG